MLQLFLRARLDFGTARVVAAAILLLVTCAFHTIITVEVEAVLHQLTKALAADGSKVFVAIMFDCSAEVAVIDS